MPRHCEVVQFPGGGTGIICGAQPRRKKCFYCGKPAPWLCDFPTNGEHADCDRPICADHRVAIDCRGGDTVDWCAVHSMADLPF